jgi:beta-phosphoglucomutase-like phosphatase (HAD superfamily)/dTDP-glucose pyrophosphorylase
MIKNIIFDLDGVIFDGVKFHKDIFMKSVFEIIPTININEEFHAVYLNGLSTRQKLAYLEEHDFITKEESNAINNLKIKNTSMILKDMIIDNKNIEFIMIKLKELNYRIFCVSNSIRDTCDVILKRMNIYDYFDDIISNEDVKNPKPDPEPYLYLFNKHNLTPEECMILEDSHHGREAAYSSHAHVLPIVDTKDVTLKKILDKIQKIEMHTQDEAIHVNIVVPMAGHGSRFSKAGYAVPKPFITVFGKPMIQWVIENIHPKDELYNNLKVKTTIIPHYHFIAQAEHLKQYDLGKICKEVGIDYTITTVDKVTEGPACTVLLTKGHINNEMPLVIINSDQFLEWDVNNFYNCILNPEIDGCINTFYQPNEKDVKWSYAKLDNNGFVSEVAEKKYISSLATTGIYGWGRGSDFVRCAEAMIVADERVNNEFYVCPVYNYLIREGAKVRTFDCKKLWGLGIPEDLEHFLQCFRGNE